MTISVKWIERQRIFPVGPNGGNEVSSAVCYNNNLNQGIWVGTQFYDIIPEVTQNLWTSQCRDSSGTLVWIEADSFTPKGPARWLDGYPRSCRYCGGNVYIGGYQKYRVTSSPLVEWNGIRVESRNASTGTLNWMRRHPLVPAKSYSFGDIAVDPGGVYVCWSETVSGHNQWVMEKWNIVTGLTEWSKTYVPVQHADVYGIAEYGDSIYVTGGWTAADTFAVRVEKRLKSDGSLTWGVTDFSADYFFFSRDIGIDSEDLAIYINLVSYSYSGGVKLQKRLMSSGAIIWTQVIADSKESPIPKISTETFSATGGVLIAGYDKTTVPTYSSWYMEWKDVAPAYDMLLTCHAVNSTGNQLLGIRNRSTGAYYTSQEYVKTSEVLSGIEAIPLFTPAGPTMDQIMKHGKWFNGGTYQGFWLGWRT